MGFCILFLRPTWLKIPWTPLALIGTAVAFVIGFQNNAAYGRIWEARKIWGGIVNSSRTFGMFVQDMVNNEHTSENVSQEELNKEIKIITYPYISKEDIDYLKNKSNKQTALLYLQSHHIKSLKDKGIIWEFSFIELENLLKEFFTLQGKSERIKNFPYPRQFATLNHFFMWTFVLLLPLSLVPQFAEIGVSFAESNQVISKLFIWFTIPFYVIVSWVFHTMERIGRTGENPFEGTANDVPISTISRGIEIDLRQNLGESEEDIPKQFTVKFDTQF